MQTSGLNSTRKQFAWLTKDVLLAVDSLEHQDLRHRRWLSLHYRSAPKSIFHVDESRRTATATFDWWRLRVARLTSPNWVRISTTSVDPVVIPVHFWSNYYNYCRWRLASLKSNFTIGDLDHRNFSILRIWRLNFLCPLDISPLIGRCYDVIDQHCCRPTPIGQRFSRTPWMT